MRIDMFQGKLASTLHKHAKHIKWKKMSLDWNFLHAQAKLLEMLSNMFYLPYESIVPHASFEVVR